MSLRIPLDKLLMTHVNKTWGMTHSAREYLSTDYLSDKNTQQRVPVRMFQVTVLSPTERFTL